MTTDHDTLTLRLTSIGGEKHPDDFVVIWNGIAIGRILKQPGIPVGRPNWHWGVTFSGVHNPPPTAAIAVTRTNANAVSAPSGPV